MTPGPIRRRHLLPALVAGGLLAGGPAAAAGCEGRYTVPSPLPWAALVQGNAQGLEEAGITRFWGRPNLMGQPSAGQPGALRLRYPAGSINPGHRTAPVGGAGFLWAAGTGRDARCLTYRLRLGEGFAFARGGKLPGLFGGQAPSGCGAADLARGFSARLMWRAGGEGELYLYAPDRAVRCGDSIGGGSFRLTPGRWAEISQEVVLNRPGAADGVIRLWVDGQRVLERGGLTLRTDATTRVDGLMFSSFFGGADASWASPRDQFADFAAITVWDRPAGR
jgi:hypothetical protein